MACGATLKRSIDFDPLHSPSQRSPKRRRCMPMTLSSVTPPTKQHHLAPSPFSEISPKISTGQIAASIALEIKRMARRKQLHYPHHTGSPMSRSPSTSPPPSCSTSSSSIGAPSDAKPSTSAQTLFNALSPCKRDVPLFTFKQVSLFCERLVKEREDNIREEYNKVLTNKLAEQYEAFLKFNHDQLSRRFGETAASYVS